MNRVLVLLSSYNGSQFIKEQIESILSQECIDCSLCIRDDGSTDSTLEIISQYSSNPNVNVIKGKNIGCSNSFLELLRYASINKLHYDYYAFADQDDFWFNDKLFRATNILSQMNSAKARLYCSNLYIVDENLSNPHQLYENLPDLSKSHMLIENICTGCTMVFDRNLLELYEKYPISYCRIHDLWLFHLCLFLGDFYFDMESHIYYRQHHSNVIGANYYVGQRMRSKIKSLRSFWKQHVREDQARLILQTYGEGLSEEDKVLVRIVANYRRLIKNRLCLLVSPRFKMHRKIDNFWFKIRVILGAV